MRKIDHGDDLDVTSLHAIQRGARQAHETLLDADRCDRSHRRACTPTDADYALLRVICIEGEQLKQPDDLTRQSLIICCHLFHSVSALQNMSRRYTAARLAGAGGALRDESYKKTGKDRRSL
jgi:hypothetical protein